ncbi:TIGR02530 family flagellar biosynthesis protein [Vallitalea okinawensis]|uniref:TIGR02530 family flagellar biosynthesis protein n=1 Tax=Vallitalea okinawensis TaxID=2078660 RepID=UPI000CFBD002|nr:TIGR02530 family flagellar biosynthesis protein [Vallitalea okinawensis]
MLSKDMLVIQNRINNNNVNDIAKKSQRPNSFKAQATFDQVLSQQLLKKEELTFTKHASMRLNARDINFSDEQLTRINEGVKEAEKKGIKDSLVLIDDVALVVNVKNKTVITAVKKEQQNQIFSKIDGAILI